MKTEIGTLSQAISALEFGQYQTVITLLNSEAELPAEGHRVLGIAYQRSGQYESAEIEPRAQQQSR